MTDIAHTFIDLLVAESSLTLLNRSVLENVNKLTIIRLIVVDFSTLFL